MNEAGNRYLLSIGNSMSMGTVSPQSNLCEMKPLDPRKMMNGSSLSVRKRFFLSNVEYVWDLIFIGWDWKRVTA